MDQCSRHDIPPAVCLLTSPAGHDLTVGFLAQVPRVLPPGGSDTSLPLASWSAPIRWRGLSSGEAEAGIRVTVGSREAERAGLMAGIQWR
jgi:hypothetical protein